MAKQPAQPLDLDQLDRVTGGGLGGAIVKKLGGGKVLQIGADIAVSTGAGLISATPVGVALNAGLGAYDIYSAVHEHGLFSVETLTATGFAVAGVVPGARALESGAVAAHAAEDAGLKQVADVGIKAGLEKLAEINAEEIAHPLAARAIIEVDKAVLADRVTEYVHDKWGDEPHESTGSEGSNGHPDSVPFDTADHSSASDQHGYDPGIVPPSNPAYDPVFPDGNVPYDAGQVDHAPDAQVDHPYDATPDHAYDPVFPDANVPYDAGASPVDHPYDATPDHPVFPDAPVDHAYDAPDHTYDPVFPDANVPNDAPVDHAYDGANDHAYDPVFPDANVPYDAPPVDHSYDAVPDHAYDAPVADAPVDHSYDAVPDHTYDAPVADAPVDHAYDPVVPDGTDHSQDGGDPNALHELPMG